MTLALSANPVQVQQTFPLQGIGPKARAASVQVVLGPTWPSVDVTCDSLPPGQDLGFMVSIYADATQSAVPLMVSFGDTGTVYTIDAGSALWLLAVTGGKRFTVSAPGLAQSTPFQLQILNTLVPPTGLQPIVGSVTVTGGGIAVSNPGPLAGPASDRSAIIPAAANTVLVAANANRKFLMFAMPSTSDGWVNITGGVAAPNLAGSFYLGNAQPWNSGAFVPAGQISVYVTTGGMVPVAEG